MIHFSMSRILILPLLLETCFSGFTAPASTARHTAEASLIAVLQSPSSSNREKADACAELKRTATKQSVEALAALLTDEELSHSARYVLETLPAPEASKALRQALARTSGALKVGIINSLAIRHDSAAVSDLEKLLSSPDQPVAVASAQALGRIGGSSALSQLQSSASASNGALHQAEADALLTCARNLLDSGHEAKALKVFSALYTSEKAQQIREAAFAGMLQASGKSALPSVVDAIRDGDAASQPIALHLAAQLPGIEATKALAALAADAKLPVQLALIDCLAQRGDPAALPVVVALAKSPDATVRMAAIAALGKTGDESAVQLLAEKAASSDGAERNTARQSLLDLNHGAVTERIVALLESASPQMKSELIRALGGRGDQSATPKLLELARQANEKERADSLQAIGQLAGPSQIPVLVQLVADATSDDSRSQAVDTLQTVYQRMPASKLDMDALVKAVTSGSMETRLALLPVCSSLANKSVREALLAAVHDDDTRIREGGIHAVCDTQDPGLLPDMLELANGRNGDTVRHLAVRGCVRLTTQEEGVKISNAEKLDALEQLLKGPLDAGEKRLVLSGLAEIAEQRALALAAGMLDDAEVRIEAEHAVVHIAGSIRAAHPVEAGTALKRVLASSKDTATRKSARTILDKIQ